MIKKFLAAALLFSSFNANAGEAKSTADRFGNKLEDVLFHQGEVYLNARYRYEHVDQKKYEDTAHASTLRTNLGYKSGKLAGFSGLLEVQNVHVLGYENYYNTNNKISDHPKVDDVESTELNQGYLQFTGLDDTRIRVGRQIINLGNERFISSLDWRQNDQTLDAATIKNNSIKDTELYAGYIHGVNRIYGDKSDEGDFDSKSYMFNVSNSSLPIGKMTGYGYFLDFEDSPKDSSVSYGLSLKGKQKLTGDLAFKYYLEYALQSDYGDNTKDYDANYYHLAPALSYQGFTLVAGYEVLGSDDGKFAFKTPLANLNKFNGATDKFSKTPDNGLEDRYIELKYKVSSKGSLLDKMLIKAAYHEFTADEGSAEYGSEYSLYIKKPINEKIYVEAKFADYNADTVSSDTQKFVFGAGVKF